MSEVRGRGAGPTAAGTTTPPATATPPGPTPGADAIAPTTFAEATTLRVGGPIGTLVDAGSEAEIVDAVRAADADGTPLLVLGGGSNLLVGDAGFDGIVVRDTRRELDVDSVQGCGGGQFTAPAGAVWDDVVARAVADGASGLEALSGIPGSTGATPVQNVGAYGQEVAGVLSHVRAWDRLAGRPRTLALMDLGLGYRTSVLKRSLTDTGAGGGRTWGPTGRWVVLSVSFQTPASVMSAPVRYAELARTLGVEIGQRAPSTDVRAAVLELRRGKGMVLEADDHDTWSAGSFFTNPILPPDRAAELPQAAPRFDAPAPDGSGATWVKTSAAWLIDHAGFHKGHGMPGPAAISSRHALALTNRGGARASDVVALAREVRDGVRAAYGVELVPEPVLLGVEL
ncbi:UDP-N-acetylmuramate dehydrogenase [Georgenia sp. Z1491]|uniref:UDP-N-acetylmuramate dehydrogenase n=1 Tax=Georgenia sp. Z1491 TaxID=3416707 RepID=UPI003CE6F299